MSQLLGRAGKGDMGGQREGKHELLCESRVRGREAAQEAGGNQRLAGN